MFFGPFLVRYSMQGDMSPRLLEDMLIRMEKNTSERMSARMSKYVKRMSEGMSERI